MTLDFDRFREKYRLPPNALDEAGHGWEGLEAIHDHYAVQRPWLEEIAASVLGLLRHGQGIHSLRVRTKDPEHLIEKIIRKSSEPTGDKYRGVDTVNYPDVVTDLIGLRALHLVKEDWRLIHEFLVTEFTMREPPIAYIRHGDDDSLYSEFAVSSKSHDRKYRSVHYLLEYAPTKRQHVVEVQVRTLFEESWSEIDHQVNYPEPSEDPVIADYLGIFNRLAGGADEMGSFVTVLNEWSRQRLSERLEMEAKIRQLESFTQSLTDEQLLSEFQKRDLQGLVSAIVRQQSVVPPSPRWRDFSSDDRPVERVPCPWCLSTVEWKLGEPAGSTSRPTCPFCGASFFLHRDGGGQPFTNPPGGSTWSGKMEVTCPNCHDTMRINAYGHSRFPEARYCLSCFERLRLDSKTGDILSHVNTAPLRVRSEGRDRFGRTILVCSKCDARISAFTRVDERIFGTCLRDEVLLFIDEADELVQVTPLDTGDDSTSSTTASLGDEATDQSGENTGPVLHADVATDASAESETVTTIDAMEDPPQYPFVE